MKLRRFWTWKLCLDVGIFVPHTETVSYMASLEYNHLNRLYKKSYSPWGYTRSITHVFSQKLLRRGYTGYNKNGKLEGDLTVPVMSSLQYDRPPPLLKLK